jgi:hypothetical protein
VIANFSWLKSFKKSFSQLSQHGSICFETLLNVILRINGFFNIALIPGKPSEIRVTSIRSKISNLAYKRVLFLVPSPNFKDVQIVAAPISVIGYPV